MGEKLTWEEITQCYDKQWVELVDYDWPEEEALPRAGIVRVHAKTRKEFDQLILQDPPADAALIFDSGAARISDTFARKSREYPIIKAPKVGIFRLLGP